MKDAQLLFAVLLAATACGRSDRVAGTPPDTAAATDSAIPASDGAFPGNPAIAGWLARVDSAAFTRWGACPFECCIYRDWVADSTVVVREGPDSSAAVVTTIPTGDRFQADTGFVRITSAQVVIVIDTVEAWRVGGRPGEGDPHRLDPGDTLLVLDYQGEGYFMLTDGRALYSTEMFWPYEPGTGGDADRGRAFGEHRAEWWAQVTTSDGRTGWIDAYGSRLGNVDACGM